MPEAPQTASGVSGRPRPSREKPEDALGYVVEHAADPILVLDHERRILLWNRGGEETFGFRTEEILGQPYTRLTPQGEEEPELTAPLAPGAKVKDFRTRRLCRDGRLLDVSLTRSRVPGAGGDGERYVEILRDVSTTRRLEEELLRSEKMAAVGKISSKVVHEIRNPLASINLNVDLLRESFGRTQSPDPDPESREILDVIKREIRRLSQITEEYLQFSRLPRTNFRPERVNDIVVELSDLVRPLIHRTGIALVLNLDEGDPEAVCDATLLRQALLNLVRNAADAIEEESGRIQIATRAVAGDPPRVEISIEDNGRGIPEALQERIYEPFFTTKRDGTGLGLALVQRAVEEHGGTIRCNSVVGRGTTFKLSIPSLPPSVEPPPPSTG